MAGGVLQSDAQAYTINSFSIKNYFQWPVITYKSSHFLVVIDVPVMLALLTMVLYRPFMQLQLSRDSLVRRVRLAAGVTYQVFT